MGVIEVEGYFLENDDGTLVSWRNHFWLEIAVPLTHQQARSFQIHTARLEKIGVHSKYNVSSMLLELYIDSDDAKYLERLVVGRAGHRLMRVILEPRVIMDFKEPVDEFAEDAPSFYRVEFMCKDIKPQGIR